MSETEIKLKTKVEIIEETAAFYNLNNRAIDADNDCVYFDKYSQNRCAVGRCLNPHVDIGDYNSGYSADALLLKFGYNILKPEYQITNPHFWLNLQMFHDNSLFWNEKGLTEEGLKRKNELIKQYSYNK